MASAYGNKTSYLKDILAFASHKFCLRNSFILNLSRKLSCKEKKKNWGCSSVGELPMGQANVKDGRKRVKKGEEG